MMASKEKGDAVSNYDLEGIDSMFQEPKYEYDVEAEEPSEQEGAVSEIHEGAKSEETLPIEIESISAAGEMEEKEKDAAPVRITRRRSLGADSRNKKKLTPRVPEPSRIIVSELTVVELKAELAKRQLPQDGRKADLQRRLSSALEPSPPNYDDEDKKVVINKRKLSMIMEQDEEEHAEKEHAGTDTGMAISAEDIQTLTVSQLREKLALMGLPVSGLKNELRDRLQSACASVIHQQNEQQEDAQQPKSKRARRALADEESFTAMEDMQKKEIHEKVAEEEIVMSGGKTIQQAKVAKKPRRGRHARVASVSDMKDFGEQNATSDLPPVSDAPSAATAVIETDGESTIHPSSPVARPVVRKSRRGAAASETDDEPIASVKGHGRAHKVREFRIRASKRRKI